MLYLLEFLDMIPPKIVGGDKYSWTCYGENARYLDLEQNVDIIFDEKTQQIYEISIYDRAGDIIEFVWRHPDHEDAYLNELKNIRNLDKEEIETKKSNISNEKDIIEKVIKLYESGSIF